METELSPTVDSVLRELDREENPVHLTTGEYLEDIQKKSGNALVFAKVFT